MRSTEIFDRSAMNSRGAPVILQLRSSFTGLATGVGRTGIRPPSSAESTLKTKMTTSLIPITTNLGAMLGAALVVYALHLMADIKESARAASRPKLKFALLLALGWPVLAQAQAVDLRTATEAGNAIIMYLSGTFAAVGIVAAGVAMMMGRQSIAKWAFAGAMVSGLAFAIVRTMWSNMGLEAAGVSSFAP